MRIDEIERRPGLVPECAPNGVVVVDRDRVVDLHVLHGPANVGDVLFEFELRRMDADHHQSLVLVFLGPGADIRKLAPPVDAGVGPEVDQDDLAAQRLRRQRRRIQPFVRALERCQLALTGRRADAGSREGTERARRSRSWAVLSVSPIKPGDRCADRRRRGPLLTRSLFVFIGEVLRVAERDCRGFATVRSGNRWRYLGSLRTHRNEARTSSMACFGFCR